MISALLYDTEEKEMKLIDRVFRDAFAKQSEEYLKVAYCKSEDEVLSTVRDTELMELNFIEAINDKGIEIAGKVRKKYPDSALLLIVSGKMRPTQYIKPGIMASALIIRPAPLAEIEETVNEFVQCHVNAGSDNDDVFYVDTADGKVRIPFEKVLFIEAREKRIFIRLSREEYGIKDTLDNIMDRLPPQFLRVHRSFILNKNKIRTYNKTQRIVELEGGMVIPISRTFKQVMDNL